MRGGDEGDAGRVLPLRERDSVARRLARRLSSVFSLIRDGSRYPTIGGPVGTDPIIDATEAVDRRFPVESAHALADFHRELVEDGTISEQAAVTYGLRFLEHMLGTESPWDGDVDDDDEA